MCKCAVSANAGIVAAVFSESEAGAITTAFRADWHARVRRLFRQFGNFRLRSWRGQFRESRQQQWFYGSCRFDFVSSNSDRNTAERHDGLGIFTPIERNGWHRAIHVEPFAGRITVRNHSRQHQWYDFRHAIQQRDVCAHDSGERFIQSAADCDEIRLATGRKRIEHSRQSQQSKQPRRIRITNHDHISGGRHDWLFLHRTAQRKRRYATVHMVGIWSSRGNRAECRNWNICRLAQCGRHVKYRDSSDRFIESTTLRKHLDDSQRKPRCSLDHNIDVAERDAGIELHRTTQCVWWHGSL